MSEFTDKINELVGLRDSGALTEEEFSTQKSALLESERTAADAAARAAYGGGGAGAGADISARPVQADDDAVRLVHGRLSRGEGLQDSAGKIAFAKFASLRLQEAIQAAKTSPSYKANGERRG